MLASLFSTWPLFIHNVYSPSIITHENQTFYTRKEKGTMPLRMSFPIIHYPEAKRTDRKDYLGGRGRCHSEQGIWDPFRTA